MTKRSFALTRFGAVAALGGCLAASGCGRAASPARAGDVPPPADMAAPPGPEAALPPAASAAPAAARPGHDGTYSGSGQLAHAAGTGCAGRIEAPALRVSGGQVGFGAFAGTLQPDGGVQLAAGREVLLGHFEGPHFAGRWIGPSCTYLLALDRKG